MAAIDLKDTPFPALALHPDRPPRVDDARLKRQSLVPPHITAELSGLPDKKRFGPAAVSGAAPRGGGGRFR